ncbi:beta-lactamase-like protein [Bisporella sp. PMI_857]|nr:beta-lactamase-like protein [Bisporella sp. PMI_857]
MIGASKMALPQPVLDQDYVSVSALAGGFITLPEKFFVYPSEPEAKKTVPSLAFLITHPGFKEVKTQQKSPVRLMFDLGLRSRSQDYTLQQQKHLENREPFTLGPSIAVKLSEGGLSAATDIDIVLLSHVHYDHHGDPEDFKQATFVLGSGSLNILQRGLGGIASHQHFQPDILPDGRTIELPTASEGQSVNVALKTGNTLSLRWAPIGPFPFGMDLLSDGSIYIIDSPGHLPGHINLLCRIGPQNWVYLGGDACHDTRLLSGERAVATWEDDGGYTHCIHLDKPKAEETIRRIRQLTNSVSEGLQRTEIIMAHDLEWYTRHRASLFPAKLPFTSIEGINE